MSGLIYKKMSDVMKDVGPVSKDQKNTSQGFKFRGIDQFINALHPALTKAGVFMTPRVTSSSYEIKEVERSSGKKGIDKHVSLLVEYDFFAEDGSKVTVGPVAAEGLDSGDKATNKALSAALKYALIQTFSIPTEDLIDADLDTPVITSGLITAPKGATTISGTVATNIPGAAITTAIGETKKKVTFSKKAVTSTTYTPSEDI